MSHLVKRLVSSLLLGALWCAPVARAVASTTPAPVTESLPAAPASAPSEASFAELFPFGALAAAGGWAASEAAGTSEASYAAREAGATELQDFRGGAVSVYIGSGAALVLIVILIILLV